MSDITLGIIGGGQLGSMLAIAAKKFVNSGKLVPDQIVTDMINNWLISNTDNWLLDGFPRTINQAKSLNQILKSCNQILNSVLLISVPNNMLVDR